jgi:TonB family protein
MSAIATLHCTATADGRLDACRATASPETYGFAEAAQAMARRYRLRPTDAAGARVAGRSVRVAVRFAPPPADIPAPSMPAANWRLAEGYTAAHFDRFYPDRAREGEVHGRATIQCTITVAGTLTDCVVVQETPTFYGFGMAAIQIATRLLQGGDDAAGRDLDGWAARRADPRLSTRRLARFNSASRRRQGTAPGAGDEAR